MTTTPSACSALYRPEPVTVTPSARAVLLRRPGDRDAELARRSTAEQVTTTPSARAVLLRPAGDRHAERSHGAELLSR